MGHLESLHIVHRDLACRNVLVTNQVCLWSFCLCRWASVSGSASVPILDLYVSISISVPRPLSLGFCLRFCLCPHSGPLSVCISISVSRPLSLGFCLWLCFCHDSGPLCLHLYLRLPASVYPCVSLCPWVSLFCNYLCWSLYCPCPFLSVSAFSTLSSVPLSPFLEFRRPVCLSLCLYVCVLRKASYWCCLDRH